MNSDNCFGDSERYKAKIKRIIESKGLYSTMNNTKWRELKEGVSELPFMPPFVIKAVDEEETEYHEFTHDVYNTCDWGLYLNNYLGGDIYAIPYYAIEWIKVRPRILKHQGRLIESKLIDETEEFISMLRSYNIPYVETNGTYIIYGYR